MAKSVKSIRLSKEVHKQAKIYCVKHEITLSELVERAIKKAVEKWETEN